MKADMSGLNQLEAATLMEELNVINGMMHHGTSEEKKKAKKLFKEHYEALVMQHINLDAINIAMEELGFHQSVLNLPETKRIY